MIIPQDKIDEIRERANIVAIVSEYVALKKSGRNYLGLCPFHSEKTPSFTVNDEKQIFYCFGCATGGNAFTFLMKQENLSFPEAVRTIAKRVGIDIPLEKRPNGEEQQRELMFFANHVAADFYHSNLLSIPEAERARAYIKKRGLKDEIVKGFTIGYASSARDGLVRFLIKKGMSLEIAEKVGLINRNNKDYFDRFRNRLMFPIMDARNRVIGFGGRALGNEEPKYLNSPNTPLFKKGEVFYGMYQAKNSVSKENYAIVVEGYFDLLMMHQYGFPHAVATLGTALTSHHLRKLKGYAKEVYTLFDADEAGKGAALRSLPMFIEEDMPARIVVIPAGLDPDDLLQKEGAPAMAQYIQKAMPIMDFFLDSVMVKFNLKDTRGKVSFLEEVAPRVASIKNPAERDIYIQKIAGMLHIGVDAILSTLRVAGESAAKPRNQKSGAPTTHEILQSSDKSRAEETILKVILAYPDLYTESVKDVIGMFKTDSLREVGRLIIGALKNGGGKVELSSLVDAADSEDVKAWLLKNSVEEDESIREEPKLILEDCCKKVLTESKLKQEMSALLKKLEEAEKRGDTQGFKTAAETYLTKRREI